METQRLWEEAEVAATYYRESLSPTLAGLCITLEVLMDLCSRHEVLVDSQVDELNLALGLALYFVEEAEAWVEEAHDEVAITEDMVTKSIVESEQKIETLRYELKDTH
ncbi:hypothetical protein B296_00007514 [Ensete ventricosum]|uniref:Uncharacterized protein n=1 Tax=Ensete ventricosum TaxID=4639 RepID=A0A427AWE0_ENSVE|nr:hypothetical protein B296_00007514 [Ensete ventricosum]